MQAKVVLAPSEKRGFTVYDAAYLEFAHRRQLPVRALDTDLHGAAQAEGVSLLHTLAAVR